MWADPATPVSIIPLPMLLPARAEGVTALTQIFTQTPLSSPVFHLSAAELWSTHTIMHLPACVRAVQWIWITYSIYVSVTGFLQWPSKLDVLQLLLDHTCKTEKQRTYSQIQKRVANTENITKYRKCKPNPECCKSHRTQWKSVTKQQKFLGTLCSVWLAAFLYLFNLSLYGALALCCLSNSWRCFLGLFACVSVSCSSASQRSFLCVNAVWRLLVLCDHPSLTRSLCVMRPIRYPQTASNTKHLIFLSLLLFFCYFLLLRDHKHIPRPFEADQK